MVVLNGDLAKEARQGCCQGMGCIQKWTMNTTLHGCCSLSSSHINIASLLFDNISWANTVRGLHACERECHSRPTPFLFRSLPSECGWVGVHRNTRPPFFLLSLPLSFLFSFFLSFIATPMDGSPMQSNPYGWMLLLMVIYPDMHSSGLGRVVHPCVRAYTFVILYCLHGLGFCECPPLHTDVFVNCSWCYSCC